MNVYCCDKPVATDTIYYETPTIDDGPTCSPLFVCKKSLFSDVYGMKTDNQFGNTLEDNIRDRGETSKLISNCDHLSSKIVHKVSFGHHLLMIVKLNHIIITRTLLNAAIRKWLILPIPLLTTRMTLPTYMGIYRSPSPQKMVIYPYPFLVAITQFFSWIIFLMIVYVY